MNSEFDYQKYPILLVDDDIEVLETFGALLQDTFSVDTTDDPEKALTMIRTKNYAVILSDQRMPKMAGTTLLSKTHQLSPESIRVLITGYTDLDAAIEAINSGEIYRYIPKQVSSTDKKILIRQAIELYHTREEKDRLQKENQRILKKLAVQKKLSVIGYFGLRLNEWLSSILGTLEKHLGKDYNDQNFMKEINRLKSLMHRIEQIYRQTDFDIPGLKNQMELTNLNEVITHSVNFSKAFEKRGIRQDWHGIRIITKMDNTIPNFRMTKGSIQIAIEELLVNAKQAIEEKRLNNSNYSEEGVIELSTWHKTCQGKNHIYLQVTDNGCGIDAKNLEDIFKPFTSMSKYPVDRAGIGLTIIEQVVTFHDGQISVVSNPNQGSKFILEFPG